MGESRCMGNVDISMCLASRVMGEKPTVADMLYFTRFFFQSKKMKFKETLVQLLCLCNQPLNPDHQMILCASCEEWFHPKCLGITKEEAKRVESQRWTCPICVRSESKKVKVTSPVKKPKSEDKRVL